jgi:hypothetical protein
MLTSPGPSTSNNWGWAVILKKIFTLVELGPLQKLAVKSIGNKSVNTLKKCEWQHTQNKVSIIAQENIFKKITNDQVGRIERS